MEHKGIIKALKDGCRLRAFKSGGGLRVVRLVLKGKLMGYGEHPHIETAIEHASEDYLAGGRNYHDVYGVKYPHYMTGSSNASSKLDAWLCLGRDFDSWIENKKFVTQLEFRLDFDPFVKVGTSTSFINSIEKAFRASPEEYDEEYDEEYEDDSDDDEEDDGDDDEKYGNN